MDGAGGVLATCVLAAACATTVPAEERRVRATCATAPALTNADFCGVCTRPVGTCQDDRPVDACCAWVQVPVDDAQRSLRVHEFAATDGVKTPNLTCLATPVAAGAPRSATLDGFVRLYANGADSSGVKIEVFAQQADASLGAPIGTAFVTSADDAPLSPAPTWSRGCGPGGCRLRPFEILDVPTETPLVVKTSDAKGAGSAWGDLYEYDVYVSNADVDRSGVARRDVLALAASDMKSLAAQVGGFTLQPNRGVLTGEVHDCDDVRLSGATVDADVPMDGATFYFEGDESAWLVDPTRTSQGVGTSAVGRFLALNLEAGPPVRVSALVRSGGVLSVAGTSTVRLFPGAATTVSLRGRRPWQ